MPGRLLLGPSAEVVTPAHAARRIDFVRAVISILTGVLNTTAVAGPSEAT